MVWLLPDPLARPSCARDAPVARCRCARLAYASTSLSHGASAWRSCRFMVWSVVPCADSSARRGFLRCGLSSAASSSPCACRWMWRAVRRDAARGGLPGLSPCFRAHAGACWSTSSSSPSIRHWAMAGMMLLALDLRRASAGSGRPRRVLTLTRCRVLGSACVRAPRATRAVSSRRDVCLASAVAVAPCLLPEIARGSPCGRCRVCVQGSADSATWLRRSGFAYAPSPAPPSPFHGALLLRTAPVG